MSSLNNRVLIVDDEKDIVQAYVDFLVPTVSSTPKKSSRMQESAATAVTPQGPEYELFKANSGEEALEIVKKELVAGRRFAGGFFDVKMEGGMDGIQTIQEIWKVDHDVHCTIVTAYHDRSVQDIDQIFGSKMKDQWDYLNKPFTQGEIVQKARQMLAAWNRKRGLEKALELLKAAQAQLIQSEKMGAIGQVARGVAHEFGNILQRIVGKADVSLNETDPQIIKQNLELILQASDRASIIVRNLQSFSKTNVEKRPVDLTKVIANVLSFVNHDLKKSSINFIDKRKPCSMVTGNTGEFEQVFLNLIINAIHAMPKGGNLEVGCEDRGAQVAAWVQDSGGGIPSEVVPRIFEYAFTTKGDKGSGLGLSISKEIIEKYGGQISFKTAVGQGTQFMMQFPRVTS